jgi:hypothetical protein
VFESHEKDGCEVMLLEIDKFIWRKDTLILSYSGSSRQNYRRDSDGTSDQCQTNRGTSLSSKVATKHDDKVR